MPEVETETATALLLRGKAAEALNQPSQALSFFDRALVLLSHKAALVTQSRGPVLIRRGAGADHGSRE